MNKEFYQKNPDNIASSNRIHSKTILVDIFTTDSKSDYYIPVNTHINNLIFSNNFSIKIDHVVSLLNHFNTA